MWEVWVALNPLPSEQPPVPAAACRLPIVQGPCQKPVTRWAFDAAQGKCITFSYGGCKGNGNQFYSEKECKEYCGAPPLAGTPTLPAPCPHRTVPGRGVSASVKLTRVEDELPAPSTWAPQEGAGSCRQHRRCLQK
ncbi:hypothetical protein QYF61_011582 [Mycteria americana]|uniref:BPTI/Kunitz inhibitor domain-containing protein n=1 Tax=Mycteria americana TaxID=33587 RepID=A0AAN7RLF7_MYCAM|nr:hypothetical protein QYF61_011582 [Mycteria americana]